MCVLLVMTSQERLRDGGPRCGMRIEEFAAAYYVFKNAGLETTLATPCGGIPPPEPGASAVAATIRFQQDRAARDLLADTLRLEQICPDDFEVVLYLGGGGAMVDLPTDPASLSLLAAFAAAGKPMGFLSEGAAALIGLTGEAGAPFLGGRRLAAITEAERQALGAGAGDPFDLAAALAAQGALCLHGPHGQPQVVEDRGLYSGQNPVSAEPLAQALLAARSPGGPRPGGLRPGGLRPG